MTFAAILVAAGRGTRAGGGVPKQWRDLAGQSVAARSVAAFAGHPGIGPIVIVLNPDDMAAGLWKAREGIEVVAGGASRAESVRAGLEAVEGKAEHVLIHDIARPLVSAALIGRVIDALEGGAVAAAPGLAVTDALWEGGETVRAIRPRDGLLRAQTPQGFRTGAILAAHRAHPGGAADDVEVALAAGLEVAVVPGDEDNIKITRPEDFGRAERILRGSMDIRGGNGFDVHRFCEGAAVTLCGITIPHERGLDGHSDADVGMHALTDAIYGALAEGDIGRHFPPSDPQWKGADSAVFLAHAGGRVTARGYRLANADVTLICERPKIGPHAVAMAERLAQILGCESGRISVKATTSERLGFTGREEGIAAMATVTLVSL